MLFLEEAGCSTSLNRRFQSCEATLRMMFNSECRGRVEATLIRSSIRKVLTADTYLDLALTATKLLIVRWAVVSEGKQVVNVVNVVS
jgi:hypothetical protein